MRQFPTDPDARARWLAEAAEETGLDRARLDALLTRYGTTALEVARHEAAHGGERLPDAGDHTVAEIDRIARHERVGHLADVVMRRTTLAVTGALSSRDLERVGEVTGRALGWTEERRAREVRELRAELTVRNLMRL